jgi:ParB-like chromosome segregation protein Spo0J
MSTYQILPDLTAEEYRQLKEDIAKRGIQIPVLIDEDGNVLDGHHRRRIADEMGIDCPHETRAGLTHAEKTELAVALNIARRHLTRDQKQAVLDKCLAAAPEKSDREIAKATGVDHKTVGSRRKAWESVGEIPQQAKRTGKDGKKYQASRQKAATSPGPPPKPKAPSAADAQQVKHRFMSACVDLHKAADKLTEHEIFEIAQRARDTLIHFLPKLKEQDRTAMVEKVAAAAGEVGHA